MKPSIETLFIKRDKSKDKEQKVSEEDKWIKKIQRREVI